MWPVLKRPLQCRARVACSLRCLRSLRNLRSLATASAASYDAVVIGGGVVGSACALELGRQGRRVLVVDALPAPGYGSTSSSSAIVRMFYSHLDSCRMSWEGYHGWQAWREYLQAPASEELCSFHKTGGLVLDSPASEECQTFLRRVRASFSELRIPSETWTQDELRRRLPYMSTSSYFPPRRIDDDRFGETNGLELSGGLYTEHAGYISDPQLAARNLADAARRAGADFRWGANVTAMTRDASGARVSGVVLDGDTFVATPLVINAAGPHSSAIQDLAFVGAEVEDDSKFSSRPMRVEVAYIAGPPGADVCATLPFTFDIDVGVYMRPHTGGQMVVGSVEPECDELEFINTPEDLRESLSDEWTHHVYRAALRLPELQLPSTASGLAALYDVTPDWMPMYDRTSLGGLYAMRGTSGNQFKNAPVVGQVLAHLVKSCEDEGLQHDVTPLQMKLGHTGETLNLASFSRLRDLAGTTGSVIG